MTSFALHSEDPLQTGFSRSGTLKNLIVESTWNLRPTKARMYTPWYHCLGKPLEGKKLFFLPIPETINHSIIRVNLNYFQNYLNESLKILDKSSYPPTSLGIHSSLDSKPIHIDSKILINSTLEKKWPKWPPFHKFFSPSFLCTKECKKISLYILLLLTWILLNYLVFYEQTAHTVVVL